MVEQLICNQQATGSIPVAGSSLIAFFVALLDSARQRCSIARPFGLAFVGFRPERVRYGEVPEWLKGADCKSAGSAYVGSNPALSTSFLKKFP